MKKVRGKGAALLTALMLISGCSQQSEENTQLDAQNRGYSDLCEGTSKYTLETPYDFPEEYDYGSGLMSELSYGDQYRKLPEPEGRDKASFHYWLFGHYHNNKIIDDRFVLLWEQMVQVV